MPKIKCGVEGCKYSHARANVVGMHRWHIHGIRGTAQSTIHARQQKTKLAEASKPEIKIQEPLHDQIEHQVAYTLGRIDQLINQVAAQLGTPAGDLAGRCFAYIRSQG